MRVVAFKSEESITLELTPHDLFMIYHAVSNFCKNEVHVDICSCIRERDKVQQNLGICYRLLSGEFSFDILNKKLDDSTQK